MKNILTESWILSKPNMAWKIKVLLLTSWQTQYEEEILEPELKPEYVEKAESKSVTLEDYDYHDNIYKH